MFAIIDQQSTMKSLSEFQLVTILGIVVTVISVFVISGMLTYCYNKMFIIYFVN